VSPTGIALVDKPVGWTSHDVVAKSRGKLGTRKVGHAGTLDPDATGLLMLGVGRATRLLTFLSGLDKTYRGEAVLGVATSTLDAAGEVVGTWDMSGIAADEVRAAASALTGTIRQVPPMVSAKKVGGRRLHELARAGVEVQRAAVEVRVERFEVSEPTAEGVHPIEVTCSSGTYVRSLVADLGTALGGGAHLRALRRLAVGQFRVDEAVTLDNLAPEHVLPPLSAFRGREPVVVAGEAAAAVRHGRVFPLTPEIAAEAHDDRADLPQFRGGSPWPVVDESGELLAVYVSHKPGTAKPAVVLL
jgi:tRNA pseudouridine55 synthase